MQSLTVEVAAKKLKISASRVRFLIGKGRIWAEKHGNTWIVKGLEIRPSANPPGWPKGKARGPRK